jgi:hypothetical protein
VSESFKELCHGYPADLIATWCCVDVQTARHWKSGTRSPSRSAAQLFHLHLNGQVLPADWEGFSFRQGIMWDPYGKPFTRASLRLYDLAWQIWREWTKGDREKRDVLDSLCRTGDPALRSGPASRPSELAELVRGRAEPQASDFVRRRLPETVRLSLIKQGAQDRNHPSPNLQTLTYEDSEVHGGAKSSVS